MGKKSSQVVFISTVSILEKPRKIGENVLKSGEIDKVPREREKADESGSLSVKPGELVSLHSAKLKFTNRAYAHWNAG